MNQLPNKIYEKALSEVIEQNFKINDYEIECMAGSCKGENFLGVIYRVCVTSKDKSINFIVKVSLQNVARRQQCDPRILFLRESEFYENVGEIYRNFQLSKGIKIDGFKEFPFCYKSMIEDGFEGLIFEDLKEKGFELANRRESFSKEHILLVLKALAKMHAIFYCLKDQKPEMIEKYRTLSDTFVTNFSDKNSINYSWIRTQIELATQLMEKQADSEFKKRVLCVLTRDYFEQFRELVDGTNAEPYAVLNHGDVI